MKCACLMSVLFIVSNNVAKSLKVYVFDRPEIAECSGAKY